MVDIAPGASDWSSYGTAGKGCCNRVTAYCHHALHATLDQESRWSKGSIQRCLLKMATGHRQLQLAPSVPSGSGRRPVQRWLEQEQPAAMRASLFLCPCMYRHLLGVGLL